MPTLEIKDLPQDIYNKLVKSAEHNRRSLTQEAVSILENGLRDQDSKTKKTKALQSLASMKHYFNDLMTDDLVTLVREDCDR